LERFLEVLFCQNVKHSAIRPGSPQCYQTGVISVSISFLEIGRSHRVPNKGSTVSGGWQPFFVSPETAGWGRKCETGRRHGETARFVLAKFRGDVFARFHAVALKSRSSTRNSQFGRLGSEIFGNDCTVRSCLRHPWFLCLHDRFYCRFHAWEW
jgi:hypothetical protein